MPTPLPFVQPIESVTQTGAGPGSSYYLYDAQNRLSRQVEGAGSAAEHLIYLEGYEDRVGGYRTRSYVDDYAHVTRYRYGQLELRYLLTDRLGSVVGVVRADRENTSSPLTVESTLAYDVFGTPRNPGNWAPLGDTESWPQATPPGQSIPTTRHGFTGHEMLSKQRLIHMRGRLFDPRMGHFTGVDPVIQFPLNTQGLNPYSYLLNNPLAGTDPTGYEMKCAGGTPKDGQTTTCTITDTTPGSRIKTVTKVTATGEGGRVSYSSASSSVTQLSNGARSQTPTSNRTASNTRSASDIESTPGREHAARAHRMGNDIAGAFEMGLETMVPSTPGEAIGGVVIGPAAGVIGKLARKVPGSIFDDVRAMIRHYTGAGMHADAARLEAQLAGMVGDGARGLHRPYVRQSTRREVEAAAPRDAVGRAIDPNTGRAIEGKPDLGHKPGSEHWRERQRAEAEGLTQKEFNDRMNDPSKYQLEDPSTNRSRRYEQKD